MFHKKDYYIIHCEKCDHADRCRILNPYECEDNFILATNTNFSSEELERVDYYLSLISVPSVE